MKQISQRGKPAILICSEPFAMLAKVQARIDGVPNLAMVQIDHPLGGMNSAIVHERVEQATPQVLAHLRSMFAL